jgi:hypothetical protein
MWSARVRKKQYDDRQIEVVISRWFRTQTIVVETLHTDKTDFDAALNAALNKAKARARALNNANKTQSKIGNLRGRSSNKK